MNEKKDHYIGSSTPTDNQKNGDIYDFSMYEVEIEPKNVEIDYIYITISKEEYLEILRDPLKVTNNKKNGIVKHLNVNEKKMRYLSGKINENELYKNLIFIYYSVGEREP